MYGQPFRSGSRSDASRRTAVNGAEKLRKYLSFGLSLLSVFLSFLLFFVPFCTDNSIDESLFPIGVLAFDSAAIVNLIVFAVLFVLCSLSLIYFLSGLKSYSRLGTFYAVKAQKVIAVNALITGTYFVAGVVYSTLRNMKGEMYSARVSVIPFLLVAAVAVGFAFVVRGMEQGREDRRTASLKFARIEFFIYGTAAAALTVASALGSIIQVTFIKPATMEAIKINGFRLLTSYTGQAAGFQLLAFFLMAILTVTITLFLLSLTSLISRSKMFYRLTLAELFCAGISSLLIGLFGKYYQIVQKMNEDILFSWINRFISVGSVDMEYKVKSPAFYWFVAVAVIILIVLIRKPYTRGTMGEAVIAVNSSVPGSGGYDESSEPSTENLPDELLPQKLDSDPCPAFTELDGKLGGFRREMEEVRLAAYEAPTLPGLVQFIVSYAGDSRLHLSYTASDIAAFIAGLGATRLTILQGMSGTGKTSLPKIFTEAVLGNVEIVEVESSWRDKNELLGYYNEFSRTYTPKKFTQALYKAKLNPERITFIVLDEMNLSRIEYYFSDFLSLMENEADKRELKLLNVGLFRKKDGKRYPYYGLTDGHTIKIPGNVWFVGTANRDESTFEISDKVYDRAHTMNFNKRAPKVVTVHEPLPQRYLSVSELNRLLEEARRNVSFDIDTCPVIRQVEELLAPYNISFGNRIANQIESFVRIYAACFTPTEAVINEAVETILLSKVVSKLEFKSVENKSMLAADFERLGLHRCSDFVLRLNED